MMAASPYLRAGLIVATMIGAMITEIRLITFSSGFNAGPAVSFSGSLKVDGFAKTENRSCLR